MLISPGTQRLLQPWFQEFGLLLEIVSDPGINHNVLVLQKPVSILPKTNALYILFHCQIQKILTRVKVVLEKSLNKTKKSTIIVFYYQSDKKRNLSQLEKNEGISFENSTDPQNTPERKCPDC
ncbi:uncharacterized protein LOC120889911 [Ictidomys tridecemlineatus]